MPVNDAHLDHRHRNLRRAAAVSGAVFLLIGILGFVPGITTNYDAMSWAGHESGATLLGIFQVSVLHNIVHLAFGVAGLVMSRTAGAARAYLIGGGAMYAVVWLYGLVVNQSSGANFLPVNTADNWLHFVLSVAMIASGVALGRHTAAARVGQAAVPRQAR